MTRVRQTHGHPNVQLKFSSDKEMTSFIMMDDVWRANARKSSKHSIKFTGFQICHIQEDLEACQAWTNLNINFVTWNVHLIFCCGGIFFSCWVQKAIKIKRNICSEIFFKEVIDTIMFMWTYVAFKSNYYFVAWLSKTKLSPSSQDI